MLLLLWTRKDAVLTYRAMDLIEQNEHVRMDCMVTRWECSYTYEAKPVFWDYVWLGDGRLNRYHFREKQEFGYEG